LGLNATEGDLKGYSVGFNLQFVDGGTVDQCEESADVLTEYGYSIGNSFTKGDGNTYHRFKTKEIDNGDGTVSNSTVGGITEDNQHITMNSSKDTKMNKLHEIFHTLGFSHPKGKGGKDGIMKYPPEKPNQNDINKIAYNDFLPNVFLN
jgi:hypothetical protein